MNSHARLTYTQVWNAVGEGDPEERARMHWAGSARCCRSVQRLHQLFQILVKARERRGAIEFESSEVRFVLDPQGEVVQAGMLQRNDAHKLIEECMIAANVEAAKYLHAHHVPAPYRVHDRAAGAEVRGPAGVPEGVQAADAALVEGRTPRFHRTAEEDPRASRRRAARIGAAAQPVAGGLFARQRGPFRPGAGVVCAFHLADQALSRPAGAPGDQARTERRQAGEVPVFAQRDDRACVAVLRARTPRRRGRARSRRALPGRLDGAARRRRVRGHDQRCDQLRTVRGVGRIQGQRPDPRDPAAARLLPFRPDPQDAGRRAHRARIPARRPRQHRGDEGQRRGPQDRLQAGGRAGRQAAGGAGQPARRVKQKY